jgi:type IV pilus assembly protein PilB
MEPPPNPYPLFVETELQRNPVSIIRLLECIVRDSLSRRASDIHFHLNDKEITVRFRVDGLLIDIYRLPLKVHRELIARLKVLSNLRTDEQHAPHDGRFMFDVDGHISVAIRVSITPAHYGEHAVLRLLVSNPEMSDFATLGFNHDHQDQLRGALSSSHGLILIVGPTGSGKTSTLYALIQQLIQRSISIMTIEDPVEYALSGVTQIQANAQNGLTFATGLRSILRQDPNVIGIGEIRDRETAELALHAALTGHLVITTLHASDVTSAIPRLKHLGIEPYLLGSSLRLVVAQRLVRRLCVSCRKDIPAGPYTTSRFTASGCSLCDFQGFRGRIGIFEVLSITPSVSQAITEGANSSELRSLAITHGMTPLYDDAQQKVSEGMISPTDASALSYVC